jgi:hypothetical protein
MEQLDKMLTALGYVRQDTEGATVFRDDAHDALIVLPVLAPDAVISQAHLIAVRNNVVGKGIASSARFFALLTGSRYAPRVSRSRNESKQATQDFIDKNL